MKNSTRGSASPSLRPDSRLSVCRTDSGTPRVLTTAEVTTGSVGESTAPRRKASAQLNSGKRPLAQRARNSSVSGIATSSARTGGLQWTLSRSRSTSSPSENRVTINASSIR